MNAEDVIAYYYGEDGLYCRDHILAVLPTGPGEEFDGWALAPGADPMTVEANLDEIGKCCLEPWQREDSAQFPQPMFATPDNLEFVQDRICGWWPPHTGQPEFHTIGERL